MKQTTVQIFTVFFATHMGRLGMSQILWRVDSMSISGEKCKQCWLKSIEISLDNFLKNDDVKLDLADLLITWLSVR